MAYSNRVIEENNLKIAENQGKLAIYSSLYGSITGDLDAYTSALNNFSRISNTINSVSDSFQTLANLQNQVADGFTMSLDKALEFASVYPEILNNATVAADGQLTLNADVVNSFIAGKKAELDAQIDSQITQLEADKAVLTAKMESAQAQLELAKNVGDGEGQIAKEVAEYRINTGNALTAALIEMGVEESKAYALAAAAMAGNEEEFARVAKECFENMDDNAAKAAYNMAHSIFVNASNSCNSISEIAAQAHETAQAIAAMGSGEVAGSSSSIFGGTDGTQTGGLSLDLYKGNFKGTDYNYEATSVSLDDYVSQLELDISSYEKAIAQIDGQIAALQALKNAPLKSFESSSGSSGSGGSSKEVEEYLADIDEYYEAMKRLESIQQRLAKLQSQIEYADTEEEKIALTKQLINVYNDEADALENLNSLRSETIANGKAELEALGFSVSYDATTNEFMVHNMEHLNELYGATQEETNELRKKTEELIDTMESLNDSNQEGASSLRTLKADIKSAKQSIIDYLKQIVTAASDVVDAYQNVYETLHNAADEYAANGYITIDTLQSIIELGAQYMQYLMDENGLLVINEENINKVLAAKTQELALNQAMTYVERLRLALQENSIEDLNNLLYATTEATNATWGLVYANLALLGLDDDQYQAALHNINAIRSLADSAVSGIGQTAGKTAEELNNMKDGLDDILKYVNTAYNLANTANSNAGDAYNLANTALQAAYDNALSDRDIFNMLTNGSTRFGIFSDSTSNRLYINANYIRSGTIDADIITLGSDWGGFKCALGSDGTGRYTYGAKMYGSNEEFYFIATNAGVRMQSDGESFVVTSTRIVASTDIDTSSDRRLKNNISSDLDRYIPFFMRLQPSVYRFNSGRSGRFHTGFIAQEVEDALRDSGLSTQDFAGLVKCSGLNDAHSKYTDEYSLRYAEFISLNTYMIQRLYRRIDELEQKLQAIEA